jgi:hypothetical protein
MTGNEFHDPQTSTIFQSRTIIESVLWLISNGSSVVEIWPFQVWGCCGASNLSFLVVNS